MKLNTIQKRYNLNTVHTSKDSTNGVYHTYEVTGNNSSLVECIAFQKGSINDPNSMRGVIDTDLLEIVRHRLQSFQGGSLATRENALALTHIEEALMWLNRRVEERAERDVLGTTNV